MLNVEMREENVRLPEIFTKGPTYFMVGAVIFPVFQKETILDLLRKQMKAGTRQDVSQLDVR